MKEIFITFVISFSLLACKTSQKNTLNFIDSIKIDTLLIEQMSSHALLIDKDHLWFGTNQGKFGCIHLKNKSTYISNVIEKNKKFDFRSIAQTNKDVFILSIANPAILYKINKKTKIIEKVYEEHHENVFYDAMLFINKALVQ